MVAVILMFVLVAYFVDRARKGQKLYICPVTGVNAVSEAVGRATKMGKKILYVPGIPGISDIETITSLAILKHIGKFTAIYGTDTEVANKDSPVYCEVRETLKEAYLEAGKPDQYKESMVSYLAYNQFAYAGSVTTKMVRERPATNLLVGSFFVTTCDYILMGKGLFAGGAYLSKEPVVHGSIKAQDMVKAILMALFLVGMITY